MIVINCCINTLTGEVDPSRLTAILLIFTDLLIILSSSVFTVSHQTHVELLLSLRSRLAM